MKINVLIVVYTKRDDVCLTNACLALIVFGVEDEKEGQLSYRKARFVHVLAEAFQCKENIPSEI